MLSSALKIQHGTILFACVYHKTDVPVTLISLPTCGFLFEGPVPEILIGLGLVLLLEHSSELFRKSEETCTHCLTVAPFSFRFDLQCSHMGGCVCRLSIYTDQ